MASKLHLLWTADSFCQQNGCLMMESGITVHKRTSEQDFKITQYSGTAHKGMYQAEERQLLSDGRDD